MESENNIAANYTKISLTGDIPPPGSYSDKNISRMDVLDRLSSASAHAPMPIRQVSLSATRKKKTPSDSESTDYGNASNNSSIPKQRPDSSSLSAPLHTPGVASFKTSNGTYRIDATSVHDSISPHVVNTSDATDISSPILTNQTPPSQLTNSATNAGGENSSEDSSDDESKMNSQNKIAPTNLMMEFLDCVMAKDYHSAARLCKMILMYEPTNPEALKFQPLIQEKLQQIKDDAENKEENSDDEDEDEDDDDEDDDDDDSESSSEDSETEDDIGSRN